MISIKGLNKFYNRGKSNQLHVLKNVTLDLPERGMVAVFGRSGCGKTTLLNVVGGLDNFATGQVLFDGKPLKNNTNIIRNRDIGYIFQNYYLNYEVNCFENVADALRLCGVRDYAVLKERGLAALALVGMEKYAMRLPDTLSGGQQQRIAIARAIVKNPKVLLADEPTGNLDEANTLMIMDLLKDLSKDRLVLLVTHEAELVDHYCDKVIEIKDGRIESIKENDGAYGLNARDKNIIYLGEYEKQTEESTHLQMEYYGSAPEHPIKLRLINKDGKSYLEVLTPGIQILNENCEIKTAEGVFENRKRAPANEEEESNRKFDFEPIEGKKYGSLFTFGSSLLAGYRLHFTKMQKKGRRLLVCTLLLLSLILVMTTASFGTVFADLFTMNSAYNKNTFSLYTTDAECYGKLQEAMQKKESAIDYVLTDTSDYYATPVLSLGAFESSETTYIDIDSSADTVLPLRLTNEKELICGRMPQNSSEIVVSSLTAERILESSTVDFMKEREDLINARIRNLVSSQNTIDTSFTVVGIVKAKETAFYLTDIALAKAATYSFLTAGSEYGVALQKGQVALYIPTGFNAGDNHYKVGDRVSVYGKALTVGAVLTSEDLDTSAMPHAMLYDDFSGQSFILPTPFSDVYLTEGCGFFMADEDLIEASCSQGKTDMPLKSGSSYEDSEIGGYESYFSQSIIIHSSNPSATEQFLEEHFEQELNDGYLTTPGDTKALMVLVDTSTIISKFVSLGVFGLISCICIFFIMRSSLMSRVKEVGIYRAIGVSKKNIVFRFFAESLALSSLTVGLGSVLTSALVIIWLNYASSMKELFYYPLWLALFVIAFVLGFSVLFGILPILFLLTKTPSAILSKYDI